jgi:hypothetical protein
MFPVGTVALSGVMEHRIQLLVLSPCSSLLDVWRSCATYDSSGPWHLWPFTLCSSQVPFWHLYCLGLLDTGLSDFFRLFSATVYFAHRAPKSSFPFETSQNIILPCLPFLTTHTSCAFSNVCFCGASKRNIVIQYLPHLLYDTLYIGVFVMIPLSILQSFKFILPGSFKCWN